MPPAPLLDVPLPNLPLPTVLALAESYGLYVVSTEDVQARIIRRVSPALNMPQSHEDRHSISVQIDGPWPLGVLSTLLTQWSLVADAARLNGTSRWLWWTDRPMVLGKTFPLDSHPSGVAYAKLFRPKRSYAARGITFLYTPATLMLTNRADGTQQVWLCCKIGTMNEHGSMGYARPRKLPELKRPKCAKWEAAYLALRWKGYSDSELEIMRSIARLLLRLFVLERPELTMTDLLMSVMRGAIHHIGTPAESAEAVPLGAATPTAAGVALTVHLPHPHPCPLCAHALCSESTLYRPQAETEDGQTATTMVPDVMVPMEGETEEDVVPHEGLEEELFCM